jgi:hypothetical protein
LGRSGKNEISDFISHEEYVKEGIYKHLYQNIPFFKNFKKTKYLMLWKRYTRLVK